MTNLLNIFSELFNNQESSEATPFAVVVTDTGRSKLYIKKFKRLLAKYPGLVQRSKDTIKLKDIQYPDVVLFGISSSSAYDYTVNDYSDELIKKLKMIKLLRLVEDYDSVVKALEAYVEKHNIKSKDDEVDVEININITIEEEPVQPKKVATFEVVTFFDSFVRIGWDIFPIITLSTGKQYVTIGSRTYQIKRNLFGQKYLS